MGKTEKGALFLDPVMTPVFDFFQYWRNVADADVRKFFLLFTFLPVSEIDEIMTGDINKAKERLAWEVTAVIHGKDEADKALAGAKAAFGGSGDTSSMPTKEIASGEFQGGLGVVDLFFMLGLSATKSEARRLVQQGGAYITGNDGKERQITDIAEIVEEKDFNDKGELILRAGKKKYLRLVLQK